jgi:hypothetical protein
MIEKGRCQTNFPDLNLSVVCCIHDSIKCFEYLNPEILDDDMRYDILYDLAKNKNSERIVGLFENNRIDLDVNFSLQGENEPGNVIY